MESQEAVNYPEGVFRSHKVTKLKWSFGSVVQGMGELTWSFPFVYFQMITSTAVSMNFMQSRFEIATPWCFE